MCRAVAAIDHFQWTRVHGIKSPEEALNPSADVKRLYDECAAIKHLTKDDPPLFMVYSEPDAPLPDNARPGQGIHHPKFGRLLKLKMDELGIENVYIHKAEARGADSGVQMLEFFKKHFDMKSRR